MKDPLDAQALIALLEKELAKVAVMGEPRELYEPIRYILQLGGKRFRPLLVLMGGALYGAKPESLRKAAAAVEVFHNFTLMHDDIMDRAPLRRGRPTVHEKWNENVAILSGDAMLVVAYELLAGGVPEGRLGRAMQLFNRCALEVVEGQQWDMNYEGITNVGLEEYVKMIRLKTAVLVGMSLQLGAEIAGAPRQEAEALCEAGVQAGLGFQLYDDYLDAFGDPALVGKQPGGDILANKKTYLLIHAMATLQGQHLDRLRALYATQPEDEEIRTQKVSEVLTLMRKAGSDKACAQLSEQYFSQGLKTLSVVGQDAVVRQSILSLFQGLIKRNK